MNYNYLVVRNCLVRPAQKRLIFGWVLIGSCFLVLGLVFIDEASALLSPFPESVAVGLLVWGVLNLYSAYKQLGSIRQNAVLSAIEAGDSNAALMIKKVLNKKPKGYKYYISVSVKDGSRNVFEPQEDDFEIVFHALKRSFPGAYA